MTAVNQAPPPKTQTEVLCYQGYTVTMATACQASSSQAASQTKLPHRETGPSLPKRRCSNRLHLQTLSK